MYNQKYLYASCLRCLCHIHRQQQQQHMNDNRHTNKNYNTIKIHLQSYDRLKTTHCTKPQLWSLEEDQWVGPVDVSPGLVCERVCVCNLCVYFTGMLHRGMRGQSGRRAETLKMFRAEMNQRKISKECLLMPPNAESCPKGTRQVCVGKGQAERTGKRALVHFVQMSPPKGQFLRAGNVK